MHSFNLSIFEEPSVCIYVPYCGDGILNQAI
jgi:hypothetical protein